MNWALLAFVIAGGALGAAGRFMMGDYALKHFCQGLFWSALSTEFISGINAS